MDFPQSTPLAAKLTYVAETGSTNADLVADYANLADFTVLVAGYQSAGKGRAGRQWLAPAGSSLFVSVLLKPAAMSATKFSWLPLLAGLAMTKTVTKFLPNKKVSLKWPNDVLVGEQKISGVLSELVPSLAGVVIGTGLNLLQSTDELPVETATSMAIEGGAVSELDYILAEYLTNLRELYSAFVSASGDAVASGLRAEVIANCSTLDRAGSKRVRAILPNDSELLGDAVGIDDTGRLIILPDGASEVVPVAAGDIVHLRHN